MNESADIGAELYEKIRADFLRRLEKDGLKPRNMADVSGYSARLGKYLRQAIAENLSPDALPDGRLYYNIAESILDPSLRENHALVNDAAEEVQTALDERQGVHIKPVRPEYPEERVREVINAASAENIPWEKTLRRMTAPAETVTMSFADDFMQENAALRSQAGFDTFIDRQASSKSCPWCARLVGHFSYPKGMPADIFRRHDNCTCTVTYGTSGGARQNVWTKAQWTVPQGSKPHVGVVQGAENKPHRLTGGGNGGIIVSRDYNSIAAKSLGKDKYDSICDSIDKCPNETIKRLYINALNGTEFIVTNKDGSYFSPTTGKITYNQTVDTGANAKKSENNTAIHETGHKIDYDKEKGNAFFSVSWNNGEFGDTLRSEIKDIVEERKKQIISEYPQSQTDNEWRRRHGFPLLPRNISREDAEKFAAVYDGKIGIKHAYRSFSTELTSLNKKMGKSTVASLSDICGLATGNKAIDGWGHSKKYANDPKNLPIEAFTEIMAAQVTDQEEYRILQKYLPKSCECHARMLEDLIKL